MIFGRKHRDTVVVADPEVLHGGLSGITEIKFPQCGRTQVISTDQVRDALVEHDPAQFVIPNDAHQRIFVVGYGIGVVVAVLNQ